MYSVKWPDVCDLIADELPEVKTKTRILASTSITTIKLRASLDEVKISIIENRQNVMISQIGTNFVPVINTQDSTVLSGFS